MGKIEDSSVSSRSGNNAEHVIPTSDEPSVNNTIQTQKTCQVQYNNNYILIKTNVKEEV